MNDEPAKGEALDKHAEDDATPLDAVLVVKTTDEHGNINTSVTAMGSVQATEVQTLLELGVKRWRAQIGL